MSEYALAFFRLGSKIKVLIKRSGIKFTFLYLKESLRLVVLFLSGNKDPQLVRSPIWVSLTADNLPRILPVDLRKALRGADLQRDKNFLICLLSVLSIFRVFGFNTKVSLKTILSPFSGKVRTFPKSELIEALLSLPHIGLEVGKIKGLVLETAGPNGSKSTWSAALDAIAYLQHPKEYMKLILLLLYSKGGLRFIAWIILVQICALPIILFLCIIGKMPKLNLGRLGVVEDQAGKARVVGITNWWLQCSLKPLHSALFKILRLIETDGTFNQTAPLKRILLKGQYLTFGETFSMNAPGTKFHGYDLSAATDRLPVEIQKDILNILQPGLGTVWLLALSIPWSFGHRDIRYAVGQPMGAYSSWAMLALTHHVIVMLAANRVGISNFSNYAVLGDDIVIADEHVAAEYLSIMESLGVSINLSKSVVSTKFTEFAKRYEGPDGVNITPIGPGLTLRSIVNKNYIPLFIVEGFKLGLLTTFEDVLVMFRTAPEFKLKMQQWNTMWAVLGVSGILAKSEGDNLLQFSKGMSFIFSNFSSDLTVFKSLFRNALWVISIKEVRADLANHLSRMRFFIHNVWKTQVSKDQFTGLLEFLLRLVSPSLWTYSYKYLATWYQLTNRKSVRAEDSWSSIYDSVRNSKKYDILNIDWNNKVEVLENIQAGKELFESLLKQYSFAYGGDPFSFAVFPYTALGVAGVKSTISLKAHPHRQLVVYSPPKTSLILVRPKSPE